MKRLYWSAWLALALGGVVCSVAAQTPVPATVPAPDAGDQKRRLIEQKIRLLESLLNSPAAKAAASGSDPQAAAAVDAGRQAIEQARTALIEQRFDDATRGVDAAMKAVGKTSRGAQTGAALTESAQRKTYQELSEQLATYRASVNEQTRDQRHAEAAKALLTKLDALAAEARQLEAAARLGEANKKLAAAYKLAVEEISRLRQGQEVVMSLKFATPAEEFSYEEKRFGSNQIMVDMLIAEGKADGERRKLIDQFLSEARRLHGEADAQAKSGRHQEAVKAMEQASAQLVRALQMMGVPVF